MSSRKKGRMTPERFAYIETALDVAEDFSEGAFWGYMAEMGIEALEVIAVSNALSPEQPTSREKKP